MYTAIQYFRIRKFFFITEINTCIQEGHINLIKSDSNVK